MSAKLSLLIFVANILSLISGIGGTITIWLHGLPPRDSELLEFDRNTTDADELKKIQVIDRHACFSKWGLSLLIAGLILQLTSATITYIYSAKGIVK